MWTVCFLCLIVYFHLHMHTWMSVIISTKINVPCCNKFFVVGMEVQNLTHPVYVMLRAPLLHHTSGSPKPVWWDATLNNGTGSWSQTGCQLSHLVHGLLVFQCNRFGYFGLLQKDVFLYDQTGRWAFSNDHFRILFWKECWLSYFLLVSASAQTITVESNSLDKLTMSTCACQNLFQGGWSQI